MKGFHSEVAKKLQHGTFVRHIPSIYNATGTDMFIETTYIRLGHGPAGAVGVYRLPTDSEVGFELCP